MNARSIDSGVAPSSSAMALAAACSAGVLWGSGALVVNVLVDRHGFTPQEVSFWRFLIGAAVLVAVFGRSLSWGRLRPWTGAVLLAGFAMAGYVLLWFLGIERMGAAVPTLIALCLPPVIVTAVAVARRQERADAQLALVLASALVGTVLIVAQHGTAAAALSGSVLTGVLCSIGSAFLYAGFSMVSGRISGALGAGPATACLTVVAAATMGLYGLYRPYAWPTEAPPQAWYLYLGLVTAALALLAFTWAAVRLKPMALTVATLLEPLTAVVLASLLLGQRLDALQWLGGGLLLASIWLLGRRAATQARDTWTARGARPDDAKVKPLHPSGRDATATRERRP